MPHIKRIIIFIILQGLLDMLYVSLYPAVNPIRASLIGASALVILFISPVRRLVDGYSLAGFLSIYSSALFGALLVQSGVLVSKSLFSAVVHIALLIATYGVLIYLGQSFGRAPPTAGNLQ